MNRIVSTSILPFPAVAEQPEAHPLNSLYWGILKQIDLVEEGLIRVQVSDMSCLVDDSLLPMLKKMHGKPIVVGRVAGHWRVGVITA